MTSAENLPTRFLRFVFYLLYQPFAWSYDLVAWLVSLGQWKTWIATTVPYLPGPRVLELGHGPGHLQAALHASGIQAFGLDRSPQMIRRAAGMLNRTGAAPNLVRAVAEHLPFRNQSFDQIASTFPAEYISHRETLLEVQRVLRPARTFVVLPVAWLRGTQILGILVGGLLRATGQANNWDGSFTRLLTNEGFRVVEKKVSLPRSELVLLICTKH
jgi:SAM-dependent methyltransferase